MVNIMEMQIKMGMSNMVVKCGGSVIVGSAPIFLFNCFSISILHPVRVFSMAFTSFTFAVILAFVFVGFSTFLTFTSFTSLFSVLFSLFSSCLSYCLFLFRLSLSLFAFSLLCWLQLSLSLLLFEKWFSPRGEIVRFVMSFFFAVVMEEHIGGDCPSDQSHNWVFLELL